MKRVSFEEFQALSKDDQWALIPGDLNPVRSETIKKCKPNYIGPLYCNCPMPNYKTKDGTSIELDKDNVYNGTLVDEDKQNNDYTTLRWEGYASQLYDGELKLTPINTPASIKGVCNGFNFEFKDTELLFGVWPGFLLLYK